MRKYLIIPNSYFIKYFFIELLAHEDTLACHTETKK